MSLDDLEAHILAVIKTNLVHGVNHPQLCNIRTLAQEITQDVMEAFEGYLDLIGKEENLDVN